MKQVCMKCGAEYSDPTGRCTAIVRGERLLEGEVVWTNEPCASTVWCYPAPEDVVQHAGVAPITDAPETDKAVSQSAEVSSPVQPELKPNDDRGLRRK